MNSPSRSINPLSAAGLFCAAALGLSPAPAAAEAVPKPRGLAGPKTCTAQWLERRELLPLSQRYDRKLADAFGRKCLGITGRVPIDWNEVQRELASIIGASHPLNSLAPADAATFCQRYASLGPADRGLFWRTLLVAIIKPEAGTNTHAIMWEQPRDKNKKPLPGGEYSIGLLQLSISNAKPYACDVPVEASLLELRRNLDCGVKILTKLVGAAQRIGGDPRHGKEGAARYWSTVRVVEFKPVGASATETRKPIIASTRALKPCGSS